MVLCLALLDQLIVLNLALLTHAHWIVVADEADAVADTSNLFVEVKVQEFQVVEASISRR